MDENNDHIKVVSEEGSDIHFMEFPKEDDDTVFLSTVQAQFPHAIGLKYRSSAGAWRVLATNENIVSPPKGGWGDIVYCVTIPEEKKRKAASESGVPLKKTKVNPLLQDLAVMNLPYTTTDSQLKEYIESNYGELDFCELKKYRETGKSRGFGFIRFKDEADAKNAVTSEHLFEGRKVEVKLPLGEADKPMKLFIGRLRDGTTAEDLREYFSQFGDLTDTYIPTPFRNIGFMTFGSTEVAQNVMAETHYIKGSRVNIEERAPDTRISDKSVDKSKVFSKNSSVQTTNSSSFNTRTSNSPYLGQQNKGELTELKKLLVQCIQYS